MIDHVAFSTLAARSIDGWLTTDENVAFEVHLRECAACRALLVELRADDARLAGIRPMQTSPALRRRVLAATHRQAHPSWFLLAAALLLLVGTVGAIAIGAYLTRQSDRLVLELSVDWQAIPAAELAGGASTSRIRAVVAGPDGFVAVGSVGGQAATWTSTDGVHWSRSSDLPGGAGAELVTVERGGPGFITAGRSGVAGAIWTSPDGIDWTPSGPTDAFPQAVVNVVSPSDDAWIAAGAAVGPAGLVPTIWSSPDGVTWEASIRLVPAVGKGAELRNIGSVFRRSDGVWIAFADPAGEVPFRSSDGLDWAPMSQAATSLPAALDIRRFGARLVAVDGVQASWSTDGLAWTRSTMTPPVEGTIHALESGADGLFALGIGPSGSFIYRSPDGRAFVRDARSIGTAVATVYDVATFGTTEVAVGIDGGSGAIWSRIR